MYREYGVVTTLRFRGYGLSVTVFHIVIRPMGPDRQIERIFHFRMNCQRNLKRKFSQLRQGQDGEELAPTVQPRSPIEAYIWTTDCSY
jgi:hypothetical protein